MTISEHLHIFLKAQANKAHEGDISGYLCSHFRIRRSYTPNPDTRIRNLPNDPTFRSKFELSERYDLFLRALWLTNRQHFELVIPFNWPLNGKRIVLASASDAMDFPKALANSGYYYCVGFKKPDYRDLVFHLLQRLNYSIGICQEFRLAFSVRAVETDFTNFLNSIKNL